VYTPAFTIRTDEEGGLRSLRIAGRLTLADGRALWAQLCAAVTSGVAVVDLRDVQMIDGGVAAILLAATNGKVRIDGASGEVERLLRLYACAKGSEGPPVVTASRGILVQVGDNAVEFGRELQRNLAFVGDLGAGLAAFVRRPQSVHFSDLLYLMERAGADGLPIIAVINFLIGMILGLQGAIQLHRFGADTFIANLVGLAVVRELAPLMTAIIVAGRSGASYAAELGTMTVNEEVDALRTIGQDPQRFLVLPRVLALCVVVPLLTAFGDLLGCCGGAFIAMIKLDISPTAYFSQLQRSVELSDVISGLIKSIAFAGLIGLVACQRGLATRGGALGVGRSTTSAVVLVLFGLVALDAIFTLIFSLLSF
jgi:phospholipid/cholesterol/gamma-HCH transport system permease protein